jgi:hypothetical protein
VFAYFDGFLKMQGQEFDVFGIQNYLKQGGVLLLLFLGMFAKL